MKKNYKILLVQLLLISICFAGNQQQQSFSGAQITLDQYYGVPINIVFKDGYKPTVESFFQIYKSFYNISDENKFVEFRTETDKLGQTHHRFKQYYKGIEIAEVQYLLHEKEGRVNHAHGRLIHGLELNVKPKLMESEALQFALKYIDAEEFMWENTSFFTLQRFSYPAGQLMISSGNKEQCKENLRLVYRFEIYTAIPFGGYSVDVDANTGEIIHKRTLVYNNDVQGYGQSSYNGIVPITISKIKPYAHLSTWNAYGENGKSWWFADTSFGNEGGYDNAWYQALDTEPVSLTGDNPTLTFFHRYSTEPLGDYPYNDFDAWDGMNVRISTDSGKTWAILRDPTPDYSDSKNFAFGYAHGEGLNIPSWSGNQEEWTQVSFDLSSFNNKVVQIRFAFASDFFVSSNNLSPELFGWQIDEIVISNSSENLFINEGTQNNITAKNIIKSQEDANFTLKSYKQDKNIVTINSIFDDEYNFKFIKNFVDEDSLFTDYEDNAGISIHWATESTYDYYFDKFGRKSFDGQGAPIYSYANYVFARTNGTITPNDAMWNGYGAFYGKGDEVYAHPLVSLDIVGHELTHGVTQHSAGLIYENEPGALNESFSDIFGTAVEFYKDNTNDDWLIGEDIVISGYVRSMQNPKSVNDPDTYKGSYWKRETSNPIWDNDYGGVHTNSSVQNYWFYLLCEGGSGTNDNGDSYSVNGIGLEDAEQIAYRNLTVYLMPTSQFKDARLGSIYSAIDLFGINSPQHKAVMDAWDAVGVYYPFVGPFAKECLVDNTYKIPGLDSLNITSKINNPNNQSLKVEALIENIALSYTDTVSLYDDGLHQDSSALDNIFGGIYVVPEAEAFYNIHISTSSVDSGYNNTVRNINRFTTAGPLKLEKWEITSPDTMINPGSRTKFEFFLKNHGISDTINNVDIRLITPDNNIIKESTLGHPKFEDIPPGEVSSNSNRSYAISFRDTCPLGKYKIAINILSNDYVYWKDSFTVDVVSDPTNVKEEHLSIPKKYALSQNYPNPFNPSTVIKYSIPQVTVGTENILSVQLKVFDILGREVATLVNQKQKPGYYEVTWDASNQPSGVYFYQLTAGDFVETKKMILIR